MMVILFVIFSMQASLFFNIMDIRKFFETRVGFPRRSSKQTVCAPILPQKPPNSLPSKHGLSSMIVDNSEISNNALPCVSTFITNDSVDTSGSVFNLSFKQLYARQILWIKHGTIYGYKLLGQILLQRGMEHYLLDILHNIHGPLFEYDQYSSNTNLSMNDCKGNIEYVDSLKMEADNKRLICKHKGIYYWDVEWMCQWLSTLKFLTDTNASNGSPRKHQSEIDTSKYKDLNQSEHAATEEIDDLTLLQNLFRMHCVDGPCFMELSLPDWKEHLMCSSKTHFGKHVDSFRNVHYEARMCRCFNLLCIIRDGWMCKYGAPVAVCEENNTLSAPTNSREQLHKMCGIPLHQVSDINISACLSSNTKDEVECIYGQLVVLGYKESRFSSARTRANVSTEGMTKPERLLANAISNNNPNLLHIGMCNDIFVLKQRPIGNSIVNHYHVPPASDPLIGQKQLSKGQINVSNTANKAVLKPIQTLNHCYSKTDVDMKHLSKYVVDTQSKHFIRQFETSRRKVTIAEVGASTISYDYDVFQIGRLSQAHGNDIVIKGKIHESVRVPDTLSGPVSRYACRIKCERSAPFRCFLYAGGYCTNQTERIQLGNNAPTWYCNTNIPPSAFGGGTCMPIDTAGAPPNRNMQSGPNCHILDGFTTYGVRMFHPLSNRWMEISKLGLCYQDKGKERLSMTSTELDFFHPDLLNPELYSNELVDGCLIDIGGVTMKFQSPNNIELNNKARLQLAPECVLKSINSKRPHCPVLFSMLQFVYTSQYKRALRNKRFNNSSTCSAEWKIDSPVQSNHKASSSAASTNSTSYSPDGRHYSMQSFYVPHVDVHTLSDSTQRVYVFPACGHVYGYHESLDNKPCPLCRKKGPFVPIAFEYDEKYGKPQSKICNIIDGVMVSMQSASNITSTANPSYVFNPCGHVTDKETCEKYASIKQRIMNNLKIRNKRASSVKDKEVFRAKCPFCATVLAAPGLEGGPYNKLIYQYEDFDSKTDQSTSNAFNLMDKECNSNASDSSTDGNGPLNINNTSNFVSTDSLIINYNLPHYMGT